MTDRLKLYNAALKLCGETRLASLAESRDARRELDDAWDNDAVRTCLEAGQWNFAMRAIEVPYSPSIDPGFGYVHAFEKPDDLIRLCGVCSDERFQTPLIEYVDEGDYLYADLDSIFVRYVSDDNAWGMDFAKWPHSFTRFVEAYLADKVVGQLTGADRNKVAKVKLDLKNAKADALDKDALNDPSRFQPPGAWVSARYRGTRSRENG